MKNKKLERYVNNKTALLNDKEFLDNLKKESLSANKHKISKKPLIAICLSSVVTVALLVAMICVVILYNPMTKSEEHYYSSGDENRKASSLDELNADTVYYDLISEINADVDIVFDTISNDDLYYEADINFENTFEIVKLVVVINDFYDYKFEHFDYTEQEKIGPYFLNYIVRTEDEDGIYTHKVDAEIITAFEKIYINYEEITLVEETNFVDFVKKILVY